MPLDLEVPLLRDGYSDVPFGKIAAVVTLLEMRAPAPRRDEPSGEGWELRRIERPDPGWYRTLFRRVGEEWLWFSRLLLTDDALTAILHDPHVELHVLWVGDRPEGLMELKHRAEGECELNFFGLTSAMVGKGAGRWMMNRAIQMVWARPISRFTLRTCTNDHPGALAFYLRSGFTAVARQIEVADDPRLTGVLSTAAASRIPIVTRRISVGS